MKHEPVSPEEVDYRVNYAQMLMMDGLTKQQAYHNIMENKKAEWNIERRQVYNYLKKAEDRIAKLDSSTPRDRQIARSKQIHRLDREYFLASQSGDRANAISAVNSTIRLLRLNEPQADISWEQDVKVDNPGQLEEFVMMLLGIAQRDPVSFARLYENVETTFKALPLEVTYVLPELE